MKKGEEIFERRFDDIVENIPKMVNIDGMDEFYSIEGIDKETHLKFKDFVLDLIT